MNIRIALIGDHGGELDAHDIQVNDRDDIDATISVAVVKLVQHTWTLSPGDMIKITATD